MALAGPLCGGIGAIGCFLYAWWLSHISCPAIFPTIITFDPSAVCLSYLDQGFIWLRSAQIAFLLNLFNLLPLLPLDGGRIVGAVSRWIWPVGFAIACVWLFARFDPFVLSLTVYGSILTVLDLIARQSKLRSIPKGIVEFANAITWRRYADMAPPSIRQRIAIGTIYLVLAIALGYSYYHLTSIFEVFNTYIKHLFQKME
jgi:Zn-dependent protease